MESMSKKSSGRVIERIRLDDVPMQVVRLPVDAEALAVVLFEDRFWLVVERSISSMPSVRYNLLRVPPDKPFFPNDTGRHLVTVSTPEDMLSWYIEEQQ
jgi:hypothetical protein